jgi:hypothetical protein
MNVTTGGEMCVRYYDIHYVGRTKNIEFTTRSTNGDETTLQFNPEEWKQFEREYERFKEHGTESVNLKTLFGDTS